jgi:oligosaccharide repeat unit polymerase
MRIRYRELIINFSIIAVIPIFVLFDRIEIMNRFHQYVLIFCILGYIFIRLNFLKGNFDVFSPAIGLTVLLFLYSTISALYIEEKGLTYYGDIIDSRTTDLYYLTCLTGLIGIAVGILLTKIIRIDFNKFKLIRKFLIKNKEFRKKIFFFTILISIPLSFKLFPLFNFINVPSYYERALALRVERLDDISSGISETFLLNLPITLILCCSTLLIFSTKRIVYIFLGFFILFSYLAQNTLAGWRGQVVAAAIIPVMYYHYRIKRISLKKAAFAGMAVLIFMNTLSFVRNTSDPMEMIDLVVDAVKSDDTNFIKIQSSTELYTAMNLHRLISGIENGDTTYTYGYSIITELMVFIPKIIFPSRPLALSELFVETFYPGIFEKGGGYGFFFLQEGYWAFGILGVLFFMIFYGWCVQTIYNWIKKNIEYDIIIFIYSSIYYVLVVSAVRTGVILLFKSVIIGLLPFIIVVYLPFKILKIRQ